MPNFEENRVELKGAGGIVVISTPFVAGVAVASLWGPSSDLFPTLCLLTAAAALTASILHPKAGRPLLCAALFFTGAFTFLSRNLTSGIHIFTNPLNADWLKSIIHSIPFPHDSSAPLLCALLCGDRSGLTVTIVESFRAAGASHILALSGLHLGVIYAVILRCFSTLGNSKSARITRCCVTILLCGAYSLMTGAGPSIVRAFLFITIREILAVSPHRKMKGTDIFCAALTIQLAVSPESIASVGFQLSYLAMAGIFLLLPVLESWWPEDAMRHGPMKKLWTVMALSISCQAFTAPLVWIRFHSLPGHFLLTNIIALPLSELIIASALVAILAAGAGFTPEWLAAIVDQFCEILLQCLGIIVKM